MIFAFFTQSLGQKIKTIEVEIPIGYGTIFGGDKHAADIVEYDAFNSKKYIPLYLKTTPRIIFNGTVYVRFKKFSLGIKFVSLKFKSSLEGKIITPPLSDKGLRFWETDLFPLDNNTEPDGVSTIWYGINNNFQLRSLNIFVAHNVHAGAKNSLSLFYGMEFLKPHYEIEFYMTEHAYKNSEYGTFDNKISVKSVHRADFGGLWFEGLGQKTNVLFGPSVGLSYTRQVIGNFATTLAINQSLVLGYYMADGYFYVINDIHFSNTETGSVIVHYHRPEVLFKRLSRIMVPVTENSFEIVYVVNRYFTIGSSVEYYIYWNMPLGPRYDSPWGQGRWVNKVENISVGSLALKVKFSF